MSDQEKDNFFKYFDRKTKNTIKNIQFIEHEALLMHDHSGIFDFMHHHHSDNEFEAVVSRERKKFMMNKKYLFIYDHKEIWHFDLTGDKFK